MAEIRVVVAGACGKMGREVVKAVSAAEGMAVVAAVDLACVGTDAGDLAGAGTLGVPVSADLAQAITASTAEVFVDFTRPDTIMANLRIAVPLGIACVVGTTGLTAGDLDELRALAAQSGAPVFIAPNFAIGAVLMMQFARQAAQHFDYAEVIEFHHEKKLDAPSGTALRTAELMREGAQGRLTEQATPEDGEASRGLPIGNIRVHAVRLPGMVASQEVIFGGLGQTLTIRHDTINRESFMPGVVLAIRKVCQLHGVVVGLEHLL
ncbi:MAG: 4-hydroxy-tetrahydrodipicolinate reductase [Armatimonadota bacterium]